MKVNLTKINRYSTKKDGTPYQSKNGNPFQRVIIETQEHEEAISLLDFDNATQNKKAGDTLEIENLEKDDYGYSADIAEEGKGQSAEDEMKVKIHGIQYTIDHTIIPLLEKIADAQGITKTESKSKDDGIDYPEDEDITADDIPF